MNTIFIISIIILVVIIIVLINLFIAANQDRIDTYKKLDNNREYVKTLQELIKNNPVLKEKELQIKEKQEQLNKLFYLMTLKFKKLLTEHEANIISNNFPFKYSSNIEQNINPLNSIRFKKTSEGVNTYVNGAVKPTDVIIELENYNCLSLKNIKFIEELNNIDTNNITKEEIDKLSNLIK